MSLQGESTLSDAEKAMEAMEAMKLVGQLGDAIESMQEHESKFVFGMSDRLERFGEKTQVSNKQLFWLRDLALKY